MLKVRCKVAPSPIDGLGLFADEDIPAGTLIAQFDPRFDRVFDDARTYVLGETGLVQDFIAHFGYLLDRRWWIPMDELRYMNHSVKPNVDSGKDYIRDIAICDIAKGDELVCDYRTFDASYRDKFGTDPDTDPSDG